MDSSRSQLEGEDPGAEVFSTIVSGSAEAVEQSNPRIKLSACGTLTHGEKRRRSHAAAYPRRYAHKGDVD